MSFFIKHIKKIFSGHNKNRSITLILIVLVLIALVLGCLIYLQLSSGTSQKQKTVQQRSTESFEPNQKNDISADEQAVLNPPAKGSPDSAFKQHAELVQRLAKDREYLDITGCVANPVVFHIKYKTKIAIKNSDGEKHAIVFDPTHVYDIPPHAITETTIDFPHGVGIYGYGCDMVPHSVGMFLVTN